MKEASEKSFRERLGKKDRKQFDASIKCNDGTVIVGYLKFEDFYPLSLNSYTNNIIRMHFHISHLNEVVTLLRYEKPLQLWFDDVKNVGRIQTISHEPVGEQE